MSLFQQIETEVKGKDVKIVFPEGMDERIIEEVECLCLIADVPYIECKFDLTGKVAGMFKAENGEYTFTLINFFNTNNIFLNLIDSGI